MKDTIYNLLAQQGDMTWQQITMHILVSAVIGLFIFISYVISHKGTIYSKKFGVTLIVLTVMTGTVMTVIGNNIALSLGMVGALSIVRFRTAIKDSRDTVYIFWTIIVGICCGVGDYLVAAVGSSAIFLIFLIMGAIRSDNRMLLIIRAGRSKQNAIQAQVFKIFKNKAVLRVRNTSESHIEFIYEITQKTLKETEKRENNVCDAIYALGEIEYVNVVMQNDEVSN